MKATNAAAESETQHPPLAHDASGNRLPIPPGTCTWQICRHTEGRPKIIKGPDKQPARFALDTTAEDLADACGADTYRIYAANAVGDVISHVTNVDVGRERRNASEPEVAPGTGLRTAVLASDLRYALEAVTAIARTNADAMRAVAESQADWIKSISSARGFFRNAPAQLPAKAEARNDNDEDDDDDDDEDEELEPPKPAAIAGMDWKTMIEPIVGIAVEKVFTLVTSRGTKSDAPFDIRDYLDWRRAAAKAAPAATSGASLPAAEPERAHDPKAFEQALFSKATDIALRLAPAERGRLIKLAPRFSKHMHQPDVAEMLGLLIPMPTEEAAEWVRSHLDALEKMFAS